MGSFPKGYDPKPVGEHLPITGGKGFSKGGGRVVVRGLWKKPRLNLNWLKRAVISNGGHEPNEKQHCVMEAFSIATGQRFGANPICVSDEITDTLISANDSFKTNKQRAKLKRVLPKIMGTAPLRIVRKGNGLWEEKDRQDKAYKEVETRRRAYTQKYLARKGVDSVEALVTESKTPEKDVIALVERLASMRPKRALKHKHSKASKRIQRSLV